MIITCWCSCQLTSSPVYIHLSLRYTYVYYMSYTLYTAYGAKMLQTEVIHLVCVQYIRAPPQGRRLQHLELNKDLPAKFGRNIIRGEVATIHQTSCNGRKSIIRLEKAATISWGPIISESVWVPGFQWISLLLISFSANRLVCRRVGGAGSGLE